MLLDNDFLRYAIDEKEWQATVARDPTKLNIEISVLKRKLEEAMNDEIRKQLDEDIKKFFEAGGQIDVRKRGESVTLDATNKMPAGFYIDDNLEFHKKRPR